MKDFPRNILNTQGTGAGKSVSDVLPVSQEQDNLFPKVVQCPSAELVFLETNSTGPGSYALGNLSRSYSTLFSGLELFL